MRMLQIMLETAGLSDHIRKISVNDILTSLDTGSADIDGDILVLKLCGWIWAGCYGCHKWKKRHTPQQFSWKIAASVRVNYSQIINNWEGRVNKISGSTFYFRRVFPTIWFGFLGLFIIIAIASGAVEKDLISLIAPLMMMVFGYFLFKKMVWDLADEVIDAGELLIFRKGGKEQRVNFRDIINISYAQMSSPERVVIHTRVEGPLGKELAFSLPMRFNPFAKNPLVNELIYRMDRVKNS